MSLALKFDNITDWKIDGSFFRRGTHSAVVGSAGCYVRADNPDWNFLKRTTHGGGLTLDFGGPVWVGLYVYNNGAWTRGGYLEEIESRFAFYGVGGGEITVKTLGVRPAAYTGGVKIDGFDSPAPSWTDITRQYPSVTAGTIEIYEQQPLIWNNTRIYCENWRAVGVKQGSNTNDITMSATVYGAFLNDIHWGWQ